MAKPTLVASGDGWDLKIHISSKNAKVGDEPTVNQILSAAVRDLNTALEADSLTSAGPAEVIRLQAEIAKGTITVPPKASP